MVVSNTLLIHWCYLHQPDKLHWASIIDVDFHGQVLEAEDGTKTLEWYDVPKGAKFEYTNDERHDAAYVRKPCYTKELING